tara:strand:+ start:472 stop:603 length:132 start_codon:yes stop_codon:yes gene_type:complete
MVINFDSIQYIKKIKLKRKWYPMWYPKDIFGSIKQKTPQEEGF